MRFVPARTIRDGSNPDFAWSWERPLLAGHDVYREFTPIQSGATSPDHARARRQGRLNRESALYNEAPPPWQSRTRRLGEVIGTPTKSRPGLTFTSSFL
ncbi:MAG: hypothetical protein WAL39_22075, partial [Xanthobacteraceae bacterium]